MSDPSAPHGVPTPPGARSQDAEPRERTVRFGSYLQEINLRQRRVSYGRLFRHEPITAEQQDASPGLRLRSVDVLRLVQPYITVRLVDQLKAVATLSAYLFLFQLLILRQSVQDSWVISGGLAAVVIGLMLFMEGLRVGLMPFGETIGHILPRRSPLPLVLTIAFLLGVGVTFAEPAIGALQAAGSVVDAARAPHLYVLLNQWAGTLVFIVGAGVGAAAVLGTVRFLYGWSLKPLIYASTIPTLLLTAWFMTDEHLRTIVGLAWDTGGVTTGPVTVPLVLALGIGIASSAGKGHTALSGFGIVTLASLFPVLGVMLLALYVSGTVNVAEVVAAAQAAAQVATQAPWYGRSPWVEIVLGVRAIVPLILFLTAVLYLVLRERMRDRVKTLYGLTLSVMGMVTFNLGLTYGLAKLGGQSGSLVPAAFAQLADVPASPLYPVVVGVGIAVLFALALGFGATLAEPALNALGQTVEDLTSGVFRKSMLMYAVSTGVGVGVGLGVLKIIFELPLGWMLIALYAVALLLTAASTEEYVNVAWDSAGVTTGPVTVPLVLAMGLGFGGAVGATEGFGILAMASIGPIISVLSTGLWVRWRISARHHKEDIQLADTT